ncbi:hypothetical protein ATANTOWER_019599 [Ataeniobius toweri]|uniref:Uncharacterized protein n=1 Tax=Ataeniobius toweri TaxID=208326 RepID=A0ABU7A0D8_9TELE|nr:hypothetical protein [Ataeniobius toweri]
MLTVLLTSDKPIWIAFERLLDNATCNNPLTSIPTWVTTACRPINIVEDKGLLQIRCIASDNYTYKSRATTVSKIHSLYEEEKAKVEEALGGTNTVALTRDNWTSVSNHS